MSLKILQPGVQPLGQFDLLDTDAALLGGEVMALQSIVTSSGDLAAKDVLDGYVHSLKRTVATRYNRKDGYGPWMLADDGITGYGTLFGSVVGGTVGQSVNTGAVLGPHTTTGSGKVTLWNQPGLYAVSLDAACDQAATGLVPANASLDTGTTLTFCPTTTGSAADYGKLTVLGSVAAASNTSVVGHFVSFETKGSLVNTPSSLVSALSGSATYEFAVFHFHPKQF
jgi:hypothetical protein